MTTKTNPPALQLTDSVDKLPGVGPSVQIKLARLGVQTIGDLLGLIPHRLEDRSQLVPIPSLRVGESVVIKGEIEAVHSRRSQRGVLIIQAKLRDQSGAIDAVWFNQRYLLGQLRVGLEIMLYGEKRLVPSMKNPFFVKKIITELAVAPIYPTTAGLSQIAIARLIRAARPAIGQLVDIVPATIRQQNRLPSHAAAITACHFAQTDQDLTAATRLIAFEELLVLATQILQAKNDRLKITGPKIKIDADWLKKMVTTLPFTLTPGQRRAAWAIIQDLAAPQPMYRLLYGEVGSGKTIVALLAAAAVVNSGRQVVWLNPTAVLAAQHAETIRQIVEPLGLTVAVITGAKKEAHAEADIIIGTHALLESKLKFARLGLVIVDEQHRFGVDQRQQLLDRYPRTHFLMMTATPIPRSLAQTIFSYLDITHLPDKPPDQQPVETVIFTEKTRPKVEAAIEVRLTNGEPGFVICPLIDPSQTDQPSLFADERKATATEEKRLRQRFPEARIGVVHGRIPIKNREQLLTDFKTGQIDILLSTTVVEVGIDNPAATWILIEEADRFGLATLHQLRGRVGRGRHSAVCYLAETVQTDRAKKRLAILQESTDGLAIAEADLSLRGPGELIGAEQSGLPQLRFATLADTELIAATFSAAAEIIHTGLDQYPELAQEVLQQNHDETYRRS